MSQVDDDVDLDGEGKTSDVGGCSEATTDVGGCSEVTSDGDCSEATSDIGGCSGLFGRWTPEVEG